MNTPNQMHLSAAQDWISENGYPKTEADLSQMTKDVLAAASKKVEAMTEMALEGLAEMEEDKKAGVETIQGQRGKQFLYTVYDMVRAG